MRSSEMNTAKYWLNTELRNGYGLGSTDFTYKTLWDFLYETQDTSEFESAEDFDNYIEQMEMCDVNDILVDSGIAPVLYNFERERKHLAVLIGVYIGELSVNRNLYNDSISLMDVVTNYADTVDLDIIEENDHYVIDTEAMREIAKEYAVHMVEHLNEKKEI